MIKVKVGKFLRDHIPNIVELYKKDEHLFNSLLSIEGTQEEILGVKLQYSLFIVNRGVKLAKRKPVKV